MGQSKGENKNLGFSLVELIIVVAIMVTLVGITAPSYLKFVEKSRVAACQTSLINLAQKYEVERIFSDKSGPELFDEVAAELQLTKTASGFYPGICPSGGTYHVTFYEGGNMVITCSKHSENSSYDVAAGLASLIVSQGNVISGGSNKTLFKYLSEGRVIDSEAGTSGVWKIAIDDALKDTPISGQSWRMSEDGGKYVIYVTTNGSIKDNVAGDKVKTVKYTYSKDGVLEKEEKVEVMVTSRTVNGYKYNILTV